jgi:hypothetical protein
MAFGVGALGTMILSIETIYCAAIAAINAAYIAREFDRARWLECRAIELAYVYGAL